MIGERDIRNVMLMLITSKEGVSGSVRVAILDSGIRYSHKLFENRIDSPSIIADYVNNDNDASDDYGHGTQVAGLL